MKLVNYKNGEHLKAGIIDHNGAVRDLSAFVSRIDSSTLSSGLLRDIGNIDIDSLDLINQDVALGPCVSNPGKIVCVGLNYTDHAREMNIDLPIEPVIFLKATSSIAGPNDNLVIPQRFIKCDWEVELAVVMVKTGKDILAESAGNYIAGFSVFNDISERALQFESTGQWTKGKSYDGFGPIGPWLVTPDEIESPRNLNLWLEVNGERYQSSNTSQMKEDVYSLVAYISKCMTLHPGDIIATGTPPGVGFGLSPPRYLKDGDLVRAGIDGLGVQTFSVRVGEKSS